MYTDFIDNSNSKARQMGRINELIQRQKLKDDEYYEENKCHGVNCRKILTDAEKKFSERVYKKHLCFHCQRKEKVG